MHPQSAAILPLNNSSPDEIIPELQQVFQSEEGGLSKGMVSFQPLQRLNAILVLARDKASLQTTANWVNRLDQTATGGDNLYVYHVENGKAADLADILNDVFNETGEGGKTREGGKGESEAAVAPGRDVTQLTTRAGANSDETQGRPQTKKKNTSRAAHRAANANASVRITADETANTLIIRASRQDYRKVRAMLERIDRPALQVHINAIIAEVTLNDSLRFGVQVYFRSKKDHGSIGWFKGTELPLSQTFPGLNFILGSESNPRVVLDALSEVTDVKVVSSPSLVVLDNQSAKLQVGDEVPVTTQTSQSTSNSDSPVVNSIQFRNTGVILTVKPRVNSNGLVTMEVQQEVSNVANATDTGSLTPTISQRKISSIVSVYSGQMVVLGGLISERKSVGKQGTPVIDNIPILKDLMGVRKDSGARTELIVFIKPEVIRDGRDAERVTREVQSRLRMLYQPGGAKDH